jgi:hypothetical protein
VILISPARRGKHRSSMHVTSREHKNSSSSNTLLFSSLALDPRIWTTNWSGFCPTSGASPILYWLSPWQPGNPDDARLLIVDGHGSHTSDEFMTMCYLNNVYLLFLPAHTSHVLQPLDLGCFSSLKAVYRRQVGEHMALTDETRVGKARFLEFYTNARQIGLSKANIQSGWRAIGLYPRNVNKPLL